MLFRRVLSRAVIMSFITAVVMCPTLSFADRVVMDDTTFFGRITSVTATSVVLATGCSGTNAREIEWENINQFGGIVFDKTCDANWHMITAGATEAGKGPNARWFGVTFSNGSFLWAKEIKLDTGGILQLKVAKSGAALRGPITEVSQISRNTVYVNSVDATSFKWPSSYNIVRK